MVVKARRGEREKANRERIKKLGKRADSSPILASNFLFLNAWNPSLFIRSKRGIFYLWDKSWSLIQMGKILIVGSKVRSWTMKIGC
jgi:hypothetical protein